MGQIGYVLAQALASVGCNAIPIITRTCKRKLHKSSIYYYTFHSSQTIVLT